MRIDDDWEKRERLKEGLAKITKKGKYKEKHKGIRIRPVIQPISWSVVQQAHKTSALFFLKGSDMAENTTIEQCLQELVAIAERQKQLNSRYLKLSARIQDAFRKRIDRVNSNYVYTYSGIISGSFSA